MLLLLLLCANPFLVKPNSVELSRVCVYDGIELGSSLLYHLLVLALIVCLLVFTPT